MVGLRFCGPIVAGLAVLAAAMPGAAQERPTADAEALVRAGRLAEAEPLLRSRLRVAPDDAAVQALLGRILLTLGDPQGEALDLLERAVAAGQHDVPSVLALGHARMAAAGAQRDPSMQRILEVGAREAFGAAAATARAALAQHPADRLATKALADALRFQGKLLESAQTSAALLLSLQSAADAALANDVAAGLRDALMRMPDETRRVQGRQLLAQTLAADAERAAEGRHRVLAHIFVELLQRAEDWPALAAQGPALLARFPADRYMPYPVAVALQHRAVDESKLAATALRVQAAGIYVAWITADRQAGAPVTVAHLGYQGSFKLATALIDRGESAAGRRVFAQLHAALPAGHARGWVTVSLGVEEKEDGNAAAAIGRYLAAILEDHPEPASAPGALDLAFLARAWSDLGLVYAGQAHQLGRSSPGGTAAVASAHDAFLRAVRYGDRATQMQPAQPHDGHTFAVFARVNLARLLDLAGDRAGAIAAVRAGLRAAAGHPDAGRRLNSTLTLRELLDRWR